MHLSRFGFVLFCSAATSVLLTSNGASADGFTIVNGQVENITQPLDAGDVAVIEAGGTIDVSVGDGIAATANGVMIGNAGTIRGQDDGIQVFDGNTITNSGLVAGFINGISAIDDNVLSNSGTVTSDNYGISAASNNTIDNSGTSSGGTAGINIVANNTVNNTGLASGGVRGISAGHYNVINNSGVANGVTADGISAFSNNSINNSGVSSGGRYGVLAFGSDNAVVNFGTVAGGDAGIYALDHTTVINSGAITGGNFGIIVGGESTISNSGLVKGNLAAIVFGGFAISSRLELLAGSNIQGNIELGHFSNRLSIGPGLNTALTYSGGTIDENGLPQIVNGSTVYAVDVTGFSVQNELVNDLTRAVSDVVDGQLSAARTSSSGPSMAMHGAVVHPTADRSTDQERGVWFSGLASARDQKGDRESVGFASLLGGLVLGADGVISNTIRAGFFAGMSFGQTQTDGGSQDLSNDSLFGGAYMGHDMGQSFINASFTAGRMAFDSERHIANNTIAGGIETAISSYDGFLVSPSLTLGHSMTFAHGTLTPSLRVRYAGLFLDGYSEAGSTANLTVADRNIHVLDARAELAFSMAPIEIETGVLFASFRAGVEGVFVGGNEVSATLLSQNLDFDTADSDGVRGFVGLDANLAVAAGTNFTLGAEIGVGSHHAVTGLGKAGLVWSF